MQWIALIEHSPFLFLVCIGILGLMIGSFLNVVILRLPVMLKQEWTLQCQEYLQEKSPGTSPAPFNLVTPRSRCPKCNHVIRALDNIPVLSFIFLNGKCRYCRTPISWRYPLIEITTALLSLIVAFYFGFTLTTLYALIFTWSLIALSVIDMDHQLLPDDITLVLLWFGLLINLNSAFTDIHSAIIGAISGYLFLWSVYWLFKLITHKEGMGYGDFKLCAMLGAWLGWQALPAIILISSAAGAMIGIILILFKRHLRSEPIPFGPFLAFAGWVSLIWGTKLSKLYLHYAGLT